MHCINFCLGVHILNFAGADIVATVTTHAGTIGHSVASIRAPQFGQYVDNLPCDFPQAEHLNGGSAKFALYIHRPRRSADGSLLTPSYIVLVIPSLLNILTMSSLICLM